MSIRATLVLLSLVLVGCASATHFERTAMTPAPLPPPFVPVGQSDGGAPPANRNIDLSQKWILGKWETFEKRSGSVDGLGKFEFRQEGKEITWSMERSGWISGVQITQRASGSVKRLSDSAIELRGRYESSNLGNVVGTPVVQSFARTKDTLRGWEAATDGTQSLLSLKRVP